MRQGLSFLLGNLIIVLRTGFLGAVALGASAWAGTRLAGVAPFWGGSMLVIYILIGAAGGLVLGVAVVVGRTVDAFERLVRGRLASDPPTANALAGAATAASREAAIEQVLDTCVPQRMGPLRLPPFVQRLIRRHLRRTMLEDLPADLLAGGKPTGRARGLSQWLAGKGLQLGLRPVRLKVAFWRRLVGFVLLVLAGVAVGAGLVVAL